MEQIVHNLDGGVSIESIPPDQSIYIARLHDPGNGYGTDWHGSLILTISGEVCHAYAGISGDQHFNRQNTGSLVEFLRSKGVKKIKYQKAKNGMLINHELAI